MWLSTFKHKFSKINKTGSLSCTVYTGEYIFDLVMRKDFIRFRKYNHREFPGSLLVRTLDFHCHGPVQSLVRELRSGKLQTVTEKKNTNQQQTQKRKKIQLGRKKQW